MTCTVQLQRSDSVWHGSMPIMLCAALQGVEAGILVSICVSLLLVIYKTAFPRITTLGRLPGTEIFRSTKMYPHAETAPGLLLLRIDAPIYFANVEGVKEFVRERVIASKKSRAERGDFIRFVIIDFSPVTDIDSTACHFIDDVRWMRTLPRCLPLHPLLCRLWGVGTPIPACLL